MLKRWSEERAWEWYLSKPWPVGCNYVPANTFHCMELWQDDLHEEVLLSVREEIALMKNIGFNTVRMFLPFFAWYLDGDGFFDKLDKLLSALDEAGITMMPVLFNDCVGFGPKPEKIEPIRHTGWYAYDVGVHGGVKADNPFMAEGERVGWILFDEPEWHMPQEAYVTALITRFKADERIIAWDLWNEPGNSNRRDRSIPYLKRVFEVARAISPVQPLTVACWSYPHDFGKNEQAELEPIQKLAVELSDVITFHQYERFENVLRVVEKLEKLGRPMMNTEWLNRILDNFWEDNLRLYHEKRIGSYSWGLVAGKSQHFLPWDHLREHAGLDLTRWQHDLFHEDHSPYDAKEIDFLRRLLNREPS